LDSFLLLAAGIAVLLVAGALSFVLLRLEKTLAAVEVLLVTTNDELRETLPEIRQTLTNLNDVSAGLNIGLRTAGNGIEGAGHKVQGAFRRLQIGVSAAVHGVKEGMASLSASSLQEGQSESVELFESKGRVRPRPSSVSKRSHLGNRR
jgi:glycerol dehydrogenase-like iron-containing ADH family enzyme